MICTNEVEKEDKLDKAKAVQESITLEQRVVVLEKEVFDLKAEVYKLGEGRRLMEEYASDLNQGIPAEWKKH